MPDDEVTELERLRRENAELRRRLDAAAGISQSGSGAAATTGGVAGGEGSAVVGGDVAGPVIE